MKIHQITHLFEPDQLGGAVLYTDLARYLHEKGHDVRVTTTFPYYPALRYSESDRGVLWREESFEGIPLKRIGMYLPHRHHGWRRLVPEATYLGALTINGRFRDWRPDVVLTACPMLAQVAWQHWAYPASRVPRLVIVQDSMAHAATELGIIRSPLLGHLLHVGERHALLAATCLSTISIGMKKRIDGITGFRRPCTVVPNWIHSSLARRVAESSGHGNSRARNRLFYSGNIGVKQGLPDFLQQLESARHDWTIDVHGDGAEAEALKRKVEHNADWLQMGPLLNEENYVKCLLTASACVVTQMPSVGPNFLPSKLLPALATRTPVLAMTEPDSPLGLEVVAGGFGAVVPPGDAIALSVVLQRWAREPDLLASLSDQAGKWAVRYSRESICGAYEQMLLNLASGYQNENLGSIAE